MALENLMSESSDDKSFVDESCESAVKKMNFLFRFVIKNHTQQL
jgi:hypothetical protein